MMKAYIAGKITGDRSFFAKNWAWTTTSRNPFGERWRADNGNS